MGDEADPWAFDEEVAIPNTDVDTFSESKTSDVTSNLDKEEKGVIEEEQVQLPPPEDDGYRKPVQLYKHWVRPKFLQYKYMYNYRTNYYDDVIDYLDKKQVGVKREIPRPQTWAERVLRTNSISGTGADYKSVSNKRNKHLVQTLAASIRAYNYHTKAYLNQKYANVW